MPNGVFFIHKMKDIQVVRSNRFSFEYHGRLFELQTGKPIETQTWVLCLKFLTEHSKDCVNWKKRKPTRYFTNYNEVVRKREDAQEGGGANGSSSDSSEEEED